MSKCPNCKAKIIKSLNGLCGSCYMKEWYLKNKDKRKKYYKEKNNSREEKTCLECGGKYTKTGDNFCSHKCSIKNRCKSKQYLIKLSKSKEGNKNPNWKGKSVGYIALHVWIRSHKPKPNFCEECKKVAPHDLANISGKYHRDIKDFRWLCRKCHMTKDGRLKKLNDLNKKE